MLRRRIRVQVRNDLRPWFSFEITGPSLRSWSQSLVFIPGAVPISVPDIHWWSPSQGSVTDFRSGALKGNIFAATGDTRYRIKCWQTIYYTSPSVASTPVEVGYRRCRHFTKHWTSRPYTFPLSPVAANFWGKIHQFTSDWPPHNCHAERSEASLAIKILRDAQDDNKYTGLELVLRIAMDNLEEN